MLLMDRVDDVAEGREDVGVRLDEPNENGDECGLEFRVGNEVDEHEEVQHRVALVKSEDVGCGATRGG